jgi:hypothetical protein
MVNRPWADWYLRFPIGGYGAARVAAGWERAVSDGVFRNFASFFLKWRETSAHGVAGLSQTAGCVLKLYAYSHIRHLTSIGEPPAHHPRKDLYGTYVLVHSGLASNR